MRERQASVRVLQERSRRAVPDARPEVRKGYTGTGGKGGVVPDTRAKAADPERPVYTGTGSKPVNAPDIQAQRVERPGYTGTGSKTGERPDIQARAARARPDIRSGGKSGERPRFTGTGLTEGRESRKQAGRTAKVYRRRKRYQDGSREFGAGETGGRTYSRSYAGAEDLGAGKGRDSSFGRNGGGAGGRRAAREAAAADPAAAEIKRRRKLIIVFIILEILFLWEQGFTGMRRIR